MKTKISLLMIALSPIAFAEMQGYSSDVGKKGLTILSNSIYTLAASVLVSSVIIAIVIKGRHK